MSNPVCTTATLMETVPCFAPTVLNPQQMACLRIWFLSKQLAAIGGTNYTTQLTTTLVSAANDIFERANLGQMDQAWTTICYNNAVASGASVSSDIQSLMSSVAGLQL